VVQRKLVVRQTHKNCRSGYFLYNVGIKYKKRWGINVWARRCKTIDGGYLRLNPESPDFKLVSMSNTENIKKHSYHFRFLGGIYVPEDSSSL